MLREEFEKLTGIYPSALAYEEIEKAYMASEKDKEEFCREYKENVKFLQETVRDAINLKVWDTKKYANAYPIAVAEKDALIAENKQLKKRIHALRGYDKYLNWQPYEVSHMSDQQYARLKVSARVMSDSEAKKLLADEFGFDIGRIRIISDIPRYEKSKLVECLCRKTGEERKRLPLYEATDYYYVRFNVDCGFCVWTYEAVNGELHHWN